MALSGLVLAATTINVWAQDGPGDGGALAPPLLAQPQILNNGWFRFHIQSPQPVVYHVEAGTNLFGMTDVATLHGPEEWRMDSVPTLPFTDMAAAENSRRFYRVTSRAAGPEDDWKNAVDFTSDPFAGIESGFEEQPMRWIKFAILTDDPTRVYFQHSGTYPFHYDFAVARLPAFQGMTRTQFDQLSLHPATQQIILGALLLPGDREVSEFAVQLAGIEAFPRERVVEVMQAVRAALIGADPLEAYYFPAYEQSGPAAAERDFFQSHGIGVASAARWQDGNVVYAPGWALGRLVFIPGGEIQAAYRDGRLLPTDILVTDGVPAEVPYVSGIISLAPSTPNSHVALLAASHGIPFIYLADEGERTETLALAGREIAIGASGSGPFANFKTFDITELDPAIKADLAALKAPPTLEYPPITNPAAYTVNVDTARLTDISIIGGKAANFGSLRRNLPANSPDAIAITFRLWNEFMAQPLTGGLTLGQEIANRLAPFDSYPPDIGQVSAALAGIRDLIEDQTTFTPQQQVAIEASLTIFDPRRKIRFRSSTNVEDSESFIGAGLYDSYSGCLADDQDADNSGPSHCDSTQAQERGVYRAIRKVYASFYNDNAYLERLRHSVQEDEVGMAVLVHHSFPDETELANGVATLSVRLGGSNSFEARMVTQKGAVSITNPDGNARPEIVRASRFSTFDSIFSEQTSSLVPIGAQVMDWDADYKTFLDYFVRVASEFGSASGAFTLDFEYKKIAQPDGGTWLSVKQVRKLPDPPVSAKSSPYLMASPTDLCVYQGEYSDVFAIHRAKSELTLATRVVKFDTNLTSSVYADGEFKIQHPLGTVVLPGAPSTWPSAAFSRTTDPLELHDTWAIGEGADRREFTLMTSSHYSEVAPAELPIWSMENLLLHLVLKSASPQPALDWDGSLIQRTEDQVRLWVCPDPDVTNRVVRASNPSAPIQVTTSFYWPEPPRGPTAGYTAPLVKWEGTQIEGLASSPITLTGYYSQSYRPGHHNFEEDFIFEPQLEPGMSTEILEELRTRDIKAIYYHWGGPGGADTVRVIGFDHAIRTLK
ncbi:hypothetical protein BH23VER1_BH23VER1_07400 [soil metagenome]